MEGFGEFRSRSVQQTPIAFLIRLHFLIHNSVEPKKQIDWGGAAQNCAKFYETMLTLRKWDSRRPKVSSKV